MNKKKNRNKSTKKRKRLKIWRKQRSKNGMIFTKNKKNLNIIIRIIRRTRKTISGDYRLINLMII